jgi:hypothetical protein
MNKPSHIAYVVGETGTERDKKAFWREVGSVWPHKNGAGFDLLIHNRLAVWVVITERKDRLATGNADWPGQPSSHQFTRPPANPCCGPDPSAS